MNRHTDTVCDVYVHNQRLAADGLSVQMDSKESGTAENIRKLKKLRSEFSYDPKTGIFTSNKRSNGWPAGRVVGSIDANGYVVIWFEGRLCKAHRLAYFYMTGIEPKIIDHINRIRSDNSFSNLRDATRRVNALNTDRERIQYIDGEFVVKLTPAVGGRIKLVFGSYDEAFTYIEKWKKENA